MKRLLIISPYFAPCNTPDMQRIRTSLPYFSEFGWEAEVVTVDPVYCDTPMDDMLLQTIPEDIKIHKINAFKKEITDKFGFGNIAFRSYWFYRKKVDELLREKKFDLIYFSTTQFPICVLGVHWKKHFGVPYVIDMQDPWYSNYYNNKPKVQQPRNHKLSNTLHKYLEPLAMKQAGGLISVSDQYIIDIKKRYSKIKLIPEATITFGSFEDDIPIALKNRQSFNNLLDPAFKNIVYIGRGGLDMQDAITPLFKTLKKALLRQPEIYNKIKLYFIGTSYAPKDQGQLTISPLAKLMGIADHVIEFTNRISYFHTLATLLQADALFIPGSDDPKYTPSKLYPYLLAKKPLLAIFNVQSPALDILNDYDVPAYSYNGIMNIETDIMIFLNQVVNNDDYKFEYNKFAIEKYSAQNMTKMQCDLFDRVLSKSD